MSPTKRGVGVEIWGTYEDLDILYHVISEFWGKEKMEDIVGFESRDDIISGFSYEIRKAKNGMRLKRPSSHLWHTPQEYFGARVSWVDILFSLAAIRFNMQFCDTNKFEVAMVLQLEFWVEKAIFDYDEKGSRRLMGFIDDGLHGGNEHLYHYMRSINLDFFSLGGGKLAFRKLPNLLRRGVFGTNEYNEYLVFLQSSAKKLSCEISETEIEDNECAYEIKW